MSSLEDRVELEKRLRTLEVEVRHKTGCGSDALSYKHKVRVRHNDSFKKIKRHISESLDVQGRLSYGDENLDTATKKIADYNLEEGKNFFMTVTERRTRGLQHTIHLILPPQFGDNRNVEIKIFRTTTVTNLKHKIQDQWGLTVEEQAIYVPDARNECQPELNIMQLQTSKGPIVLEVRWQRKESVRAAISKPAGATVGASTMALLGSKKTFVSPYDTSRRKVPKKPDKSKEIEEVKSYVSVPLHHAPFETVYQLGKNLEDFKKDKQKRLLIECKHVDEDKVEITSKLVERSSISGAAVSTAPSTSNKAQSMSSTEPNPSLP